MTTVNNKRPAKINIFSGRQFLSQYIQQEKTTLRLAVLAGSFATILMLIQWLTFVFVAQKVIVNHESITQQTILFGVLFSSVLGRALLTRIQTFLSQKASLNIRCNIRQTMLAHWRVSSPVSLKNTSAGVFASQFVEEVEAMDGYFSRYWPQQALAIISPLLILCVIAILNWLCALLLLIAAPLIPLFMVLVGMGAEALNQKHSTIRQRLAGHFLDRVSNLKNIKLLGAQDAVFEEVKDNSERFRNIVMKTLKVAFLSSTILEFFTSVAIAALAIYIGFSLYGAITWGPAASLSLFSGLSILILAPEFFQPLRNLSQFYHDRASALGAANNLVESLATNIDSPDKKNPTKNIVDKTSPIESNILTHQGNFTRLKLSNLSIGYENKLTRKLNLEIATGSMLVVSGNSGSGKTTLLNTIANFVPALEGVVTVTPASNNPIAYLPQQAWIKNDSVYENLAVLAPKATPKEMINTLKLLGLADALGGKRLGIDTLIGEHGQGLSGGQMQRLAFARVLLNPTPIILFDEPTAKLDLNSKALIIDALKALKPKHILVIASHDPLLIEMCDVHLNLNTAEA
jgi:ATP-binding cassette subfamily C protein CydD